MTGTVTPPHAESRSTGQLEARNGYRWWLVENGRLVSPFAGVVLPPNGIAFDVSYYATRADLDQVAAHLEHRTTALTIGTVTGTIRPDPAPQTYDFGGRTVQLPDAWIGERYTVRTIITNTAVLYPIPVQRWMA